MSYIVSSLTAGCFFGVLAAYPIVELWGRRPCLTIFCISTAVGSVIQIVSGGNAVLLCTGRAVTGAGIGGFICKPPIYCSLDFLTSLSLVVPIYIVETAPPTIRGRLIGIVDLFAWAGQICGYWVSYAVKIHMPSTDEQWQIPFGLQLILSGLLLVASFFMQESPRWLAQKGQLGDALTDLCWMRNLPENHEYIRWEMSQMQRQPFMTPDRATRRKTCKDIWRELTRKSMLRRLVLAIGVRVGQITTG